MNTGNTYPTNTALAILLGGNPGTGKSNLQMEFDKPYIIDAEHNLRNAIERHPGKFFTWDNPEVDDKGAILPAKDCWGRVETLIKTNAPKPEVGTIVVDGLGRISDYLKAYLISQGSQAEKPLII